MCVLKKICGFVLIVYVLSGCNSICLFNSCEKETDTLNYFFVGHLYQWYTTNRIDSRLESLDFKEYDQVWLGGDLCTRTIDDRNTLVYLDSIFNLDSSTTHWTYGNHDLRQGDASIISDFTKRDPFYSFYYRGQTVFVMCTMLDSVYKGNEAEYCKQAKRQIQSIRNICDTMSESSHFILIMHNIKWFDMDIMAKTYTNLRKNSGLLCDQNNVFIDTIYPMLLKVQNRGIQVVGIGGDSGLWGKNGQFVTDDGVIFLVAGINSSKVLSHPNDSVRKTKIEFVDKALIFSFFTASDSLTWQFIEIDSLVAWHQKDLARKKTKKVSQ